MAELLALLRANPMRYNFAAAGIGSTVHLTGEVFRAAAEVQIQFVHYRGGGPALQAVMNGEAHLTAVFHRRGARARSNAAFNAAARGIEPRLTELGLQIKADVATPEQVNRFIRGELDRYASVLQAAGVRPE